MTNKLKVIEPFYNLETGDVLELSKDGKFYVFDVSEKSNGITKDGTSRYTFSASFKIDSDYAKELVKQGLLEEDVKSKSDFKNVFTEMDSMLNKYYDELNNLDKEFADKPACLKVEKTTVLKNLIKAIEHLKTLKK